MKQRLEKAGYMLLGFTINGKTYQRRVHRLVCLAFHGEPPSGQEASHVNDIKSDNRACNLVWESRLENARRAVSNGRVNFRGERNPGAKLTTEQVKEIRRLAEQGRSGRSLDRQFGLAMGVAGNIIRRKRWASV